MLVCDIQEMYHICSSIINARHACAAKVTVVVLCVCVYVCVCLPPRSSTPRNIGTYVFTATRKKTFIIVIFTKAWFTIRRTATRRGAARRGACDDL